MTSLPITNDLVGQSVINPARPEWGRGKVLRVQATHVGGKPAHRVSIQFDTGHRTLVVPPARITAPQPEQEREAGWLDTVAGRTIDDRLKSLPPSVTELLGTPQQQIAALVPHYAHDETPESLIKWARRQANVADPLSLWSRDELLIAFRAFAMERDTALRIAAAKLREREGPEALAQLLDDLPAPLAEALRTALRKPV